MASVEILKSVLNRCFPGDVVQALNNINFDKVEEIRIRVGRPVIIRVGVNEIVLKYNIHSDEIINILQNFCNNSIYTYQNQICNGFITILGGHRVGISGSVVLKDGVVSNISNIYSLNIRVAREVRNCSNCILQYVLNTSENTVFNTLIVSPPRSSVKLRL